MLVRIDDFPIGVAHHWAPHLWWDDTRDKCLEWIVPFEENDVDYILGVSPLLFNDGDSEFLNENIKKGRVVMHGFDHAFGIWTGNIMDTWPHGGEFSSLTYDILRYRYELCNSILQKIDSYDETHFIPPFNSFNQMLLDFLSKETKVRILHGEKTFFETYLSGIGLVFPDNIDFVTTKQDIDYADIDVVIDNIDIIEHPTLHWHFDYHSGKIGQYETFAKMLKDLK